MDKAILTIKQILAWYKHKWKSFVIRIIARGRIQLSYYLSCRSEKLDEKDVELDTDDEGASSVVPFSANTIPTDNDDVITNSQSKINTSQEEEEEYDIEEFDDF